MEPGADSDHNSADLVYSEIRDLLRRQESKLKEARTRAATVLAVSGFALSFLGGSILENSSTPGPWFWVGAGLIVLAILACLWVLLPPRKERLFFSPEPKDLLDNYLPLPPSESMEYLAGYMARWVEENQPEIDPLYTGLRWGMYALGVGIVVLLADLGGIT